MTLPNFLIVGTMKSGTSSLLGHLSRHPEVFIHPGELHFFDDDALYAQGLSRYERWFDKAGDVKAIGEKTPTYCYLPRAAKRICADLPNARLIWIFREPVLRAYSNYWHAVKHGAEPLSFRDVTKLERLGLVRSKWRTYLRRSRYHEQVKRFLEAVPKEQMHFMLFENLVRQPEFELAALYSFLGVDDAVEVPEKPVRDNVTIIPRVRALTWLTRQLTGRGRVFAAVNGFNQHAVPGYPPIDTSLRAELRAEFADENRRLAQLTDLDLGVWSEPRIDYP